MAAANPARRYANVQLRYDAKLNAMLERAARDIRARINGLGTSFSAGIRKAQLTLVLDEITKVQRGMWVTGIQPTIMAGRVDGAKAALDAVEALDAVVYASLPDAVAKVVRDGLRHTALAGIERDNARVPRDLSHRVYHDFAITSGEIERVIRSGIISGLSARELATDVYKYISPFTPGGASFAAMRLARTEINNSFHEMQKAGGQRPGVSATKWNLSGSHKVPDDCNRFAAANPDRLGPGLYKPDNVPDKPHPQCLCFLTYQTMDPDQFASALLAGKFDDDLDARIRANLKLVGR